MKTYIVVVDANFLEAIAVDGYTTTNEQGNALVLDYNEAANICFKINKSAGRVDKARMWEAIEVESEEEADDRDEYQKRADAQAEYADDSRDDR
jgi:hypothetical protein